MGHRPALPDTIPVMSASAKTRGLYYATGHGHLGLTYSATTGIVMAWAVDRHVLDFMDLHAARLFTGFACGVEFWSFLENAAQLSDAPLFRWLKRYVRRRMRKEAGDV